jgi:hypothetical protein
MRSWFVDKQPNFEYKYYVYLLPSFGLHYP